MESNDKKPFWNIDSSGKAYYTINTMPNNITYTVNVPQINLSKNVVITNTLNLLHDYQLDMIDQALDMSDLKEANELINYIRNKG
jgi:hypothetical protein